MAYIAREQWEERYRGGKGFRRVGERERALRPGPAARGGVRDLVVVRLLYPFVRDRGRVLHGLGERLRDGGGQLFAQHGWE
ncbi:hypothetical protein Srubr_27880 [Streptomyces rubradiris]|uniref:Uncharacterized protein n=1 Tax=Streptomyces rubradiris TaxID=285531 RepID=A0ABQ3RAR0_STRRR|nr:hypothetical protein GCM10018792_50760 [Streptomyces rubradiris]GHI52942.1 hypothetical protein Srubr_27880 [Streptomyces rubradiris]